MRLALRSDEFAEAIGVDHETALRYLQAGKVPGARKLGRVWLVGIRAFEAWLGYEGGEADGGDRFDIPADATEPRQGGAALGGNVSDAGWQPAVNGLSSPAPRPRPTPLHRSTGEPDPIAAHPRRPGTARRADADRWRVPPTLEPSVD